MLRGVSINNFAVYCKLIMYEMNQQQRSLIIFYVNRRTKGDKLEQVNKRSLISWLLSFYGDQ